jgi:hypothetical protein
MVVSSLLMFTWNHSVWWCSPPQLWLLELQPFSMMVLSFPLMVTWKLKPFCVMFYASSTMVTWLVLLTHSYVKPFCMMVWSYGLVLPNPGYSKPLCMMIFSSPPLIVIGKHSAWWFSPPPSWLRERWNYDARRCILSAFTKLTWQTISVMVCMRAASFIHLLIFPEHTVYRIQHRVRTCGFNGIKSAPPKYFFFHRGDYEQFFLQAILVSRICAKAKMEAIFLLADWTTCVLIM